MKKVFVNSIASISPQNTFDADFFEAEVVNYNDTVIGAIDPVYKKYIPPAAARRMAKGIKMGVVASKAALAEAEIDTVDAIITGTGMGCIIDSEKFVSAIIDHQEQYLTPTPFIQSTHNTVAGQIALGMKCNAYNFTYVHASLSFESAVLDAKMQLESAEANDILVGGVEELGAHTTKVHEVINHIKTVPISSDDILSAPTPGAVFSEGAHFFVLSNQKGNACYAELVDIRLYNTLSENRLEIVIETLLEENGLTRDMLDVVVMGNNGDAEFDHYYHTLSEGMLKNVQQVYYKHLVGENNSVSAFGMWLAAKMLKTDVIPSAIKINQTSKTNNTVEYVLCYNQYRGKDHSFILLKKC